MLEMNRIMNDVVVAKREPPYSVAIWVTKSMECFAADCGGSLSREYVIKEYLRGVK
jgi:hypothetical protein